MLLKTIRKVALLLACIATTALLCGCTSNSNDTFSFEFFPITYCIYEFGKQHQSGYCNGILYADDGKIYAHTDVPCKDRHGKKSILGEIDTTTIIYGRPNQVNENIKEFYPSDFDGMLDEKFGKEIVKQKEYMPVGSQFVLVINEKNYNFLSGNLHRSQRKLKGYPLLILIPVSLPVDSVCTGIRIAGVYSLYYGLGLLL